MLSLDDQPKWMRWRHPVALLATCLVLAYSVTLAVQRFDGAFEEWRAETDTKQVTFQYYRYSEGGGTLPRGHLMTDYTHVYNAPPLFHAIMVPISSVMDAKDAASLVNVILYFLALLACYLAIVIRTKNHFIGLAGVLLLSRSHNFFRITAGGYARTFGPTLFLLFIAAWMTGKKRLVLVVLILQAGIYPSVMMPSSLAFGLWSLWDFYKKRELRPMIELAVTAVICFLLAKSQDFSAADWWGSPVSYEEALKNPAFFRGSRMPFVPHRAWMFWPEVYFKSLFRPYGNQISEKLALWNDAHALVLIMVPVAVAGVVAAVKRAKFPLQLVLLFAMCFASYALARVLAFELHVPHRPIAHCWPYLLAVAIPMLCYLAASALFPKRKVLATALALSFAVVPTFAVAGDGSGRVGTYRNYARDAKLYKWLRVNTPKDAVFAGNFQPLDEIPLFSWRVPYVNWKLAHPFRKGYWDEVVRRTDLMYRAYYALDYASVLEFAEQEKIDYFIVDRTRFKKLERGDGQLFEPLRSMVKPHFNKCRAEKSCVMNSVPKAAVVFHHRVYKVIDLAKLRALHEQGRLPGEDPTMTPTPTPSTDAGPSPKADAGP